MIDLINLEASFWSKSDNFQSDCVYTTREGYANLLRIILTIEEMDCCCKDVRDQKTVPNSLQNNCFILEDSKDFVYAMNDAISTYDLFLCWPRK